MSYNKNSKDLNCEPESRRKCSANRGIYKDRKEIFGLDSFKKEEIKNSFVGRKSINYNDYLKLVKERDDLTIGMTSQQFYNAIKKNNMLPREERVVPSDIKLIWKCTAEEHKFPAPYRRVKHKGQKCPLCRGISYVDYLNLVNKREDLEVGMSKTKFNNAMKRNRMLPIENRVVPSYVKLIWKCKAKLHKWPTPYHNVIQGTKCPHCSPLSPINYERYLNLVNKREDLEVGMNETEFNKVLAENNKLPTNLRKSPALLHWLIWECKAEKHKFHASYSKIKNESKKCPKCRKTLYKDYLRLVSKRDDLVIGMSEAQFRDTMEKNDMLLQKERLRPSGVKLIWKCKAKLHKWSAPYNTIKKGHGCYYCGEQTRVIGLLDHPIIEYYSLTYLIDLKNCQVKFEQYLIKGRYFHPDLLIDRSLNFKNNIEQMQRVVQIPDTVKKIVVDYTFGLNIKTILDKCFRQYQSEERYLLIVMIREREGCNAEIMQKLILERRDISNKEYIQVINFKEYLEFLGLQRGINNFKHLSKTEKKIVSKLRFARKLALDAFEIEAKLEKLEKTSKHYSDLIKKYK